jgi:amino-acid N-acetyltransferase
METRPAKADDVEAVRALLRRCRLPVDGVPDELESLFVTIIDGRIVGAAGLEMHGFDGLIRSVAVSPEVRRQYLASRLCTEIERRAALIGAHKLFLLTETAERFFLKRGYRPVDRALAPAGIAASREFAAVCSASAVLMFRECLL